MGTIADIRTPEGCDRLLGGRVLLRQRRGGHRAGTDAVLLAALVPSTTEGLLIDVGAGTGVVAVAVGIRALSLRLSLVEDDPGAAALAQENLALNGLADRGRVCQVDALAPKARRAAGLEEARADWVVTNPPYYDADTVRPSGDAARAHAHVLPASASTDDAAPLVTWIRACLALLAPGGRFAMIHRPERLSVILAALDGRAGGARITPVHPFATADAGRLLVQARKGSRAPCAIAPMLVLHEPDGSFTPCLAAIHRGDALL